MLYTVLHFEGKLPTRTNYQVCQGPARKMRNATAFISHIRLLDTVLWITVHSSSQDLLHSCTNECLTWHCCVLRWDAICCTDWYTTRLENEYNSSMEPATSHDQVNRQIACSNFSNSEYQGNTRPAQQPCRCLQTAVADHFKAAGTLLM